MWDRLLPFCLARFGAKQKCPARHGQGFPTAWTGERLLVGCYALEAISDGEVPLDQAADLLDH